MSLRNTKPGTAWEIVKRGWQLFVAAFWGLWPLALAAGLLNTWWGVYNELYEGAATGIGIPLLGLLSALLASLLTLMILRRIDNIGRGLLADLDDEFFAALRVLLPFVLASAIYGVACAVGLLVFVAPGLYLMVSLGFYSMFMVLESRGPLEALGSSFRLVEGQWWHGFGVFALIMLALIAIAAGLVLAAAVLLDDQGRLLRMPLWLGDILVGALINMVLQPLGLCLSLCLYYELKARKATVGPR